MARVFLMELDKLLVEAAKSSSQEEAAKKYNEAQSLLFSGISTILFLLITRNRLP